MVLLIVKSLIINSTDLIPVFSVLYQQYQLYTLLLRYQLASKKNLFRILLRVQMFVFLNTVKDKLMLVSAQAFVNASLSFKLSVSSSYFNQCNDFLIEIANIKLLVIIVLNSLLVINIALLLYIIYCYWSTYHYTQLSQQGLPVDGVIFKVICYFRRCLYRHNTLLQLVQLVQPQEYSNVLALRLQQCNSLRTIAMYQP